MISSTDTARNVFRVLETGDTALAHRTADPRFLNREASVAPAASSKPGPAGLLASSAWMRYAFPDLHFQIIDTAEQDARVFVRLRMQGTHTAPFVQFKDGELAQIVPPTGKRIDFEQIHMLLIEDGRALEHAAVRDDITMLGQLGVFPPTPAFGMAALGWKISGRAKRAAADVTAAADAASQS
jgi:predicted ester cyclase